MMTTIIFSVITTIIVFTVIFYLIGRNEQRKSKLDHKEHTFKLNVEVKFNDQKEQSISNVEGFSIIDGLYQVITEGGQSYYLDPSLIGSLDFNVKEVK